MPSADGVHVFPLPGIGEVTPGTDLAALIAGAVAPADPDGPALADGDVVVVTQKIVSKAEGRLVELDHGDPAAKLALVRQESVRVLRQRGDLVISETRHGFICANAGIDLSNVADGTAALLPEDPDRSARRIRAGLQNALGIDVGVIVSDTFGRPWRRGVTDVAIGCAGVAAVVDLKGTTRCRRARARRHGDLRRRRTRLRGRAGDGQGPRRPGGGRAWGAAGVATPGLGPRRGDPASGRRPLSLTVSPSGRRRTRAPHGSRRPARSRAANRAGSPPVRRRGWNASSSPGPRRRQDRTPPQCRTGTP